MSQRQDALRACLGRFGIWSSALQRNPRPQAQAAIQAYESDGWTATWYSEGLLMDAFVQGALLLAPGSRMMVASGIASIYLRSPSTMAVAGRNLAEAFGNRFVLGIGVSHAPSVTARGGSYGRPIETMRAYLDAMDETWAGAASPARPPVVLAASTPGLPASAWARTQYWLLR
jgi:alkanesulfonate monooxygenase SsuD/methylene tetrahydromethanopterin reductase-like flavin-dependent oxidoreductase (luciferase family)